jgi:hypothetical protein
MEGAHPVNAVRAAAIVAQMVLGKFAVPDAQQPS